MINYIIYIIFCCNQSMSFVSYQKGNQTWYTHSTWLSDRQRRALHFIPQENNTLCWYYTAGILALSAVLHRKIPAIGSFYSKVGVYTGIAAVTATSFIGCKLLFMIRQSTQQANVLEENDSLYTPFWSSQQKVPILTDRAKFGDQKGDHIVDTYLKRFNACHMNEKQVKQFQPQFILARPDADQYIQSYHRLLASAGLKVQ